MTEEYTLILRLMLASDRHFSLFLGAAYSNLLSGANLL